MQQDTHAVQIDINPDLPTCRVQLCTIDGRRVGVTVNGEHRIQDLKRIVHTLAPVSPDMHIKLYDFRGCELADNMQTVADAQIDGTAVKCDVDVGPAGVMLGY